MSPSLKVRSGLKFPCLSRDKSCRIKAFIFIVGTVNPCHDRVPTISKPKAEPTENLRANIILKLTDHKHVSKEEFKNK